MRTLTYEKDSVEGRLKGILRVRGYHLFFKSNSNDYASQIIEQLKARGAEIEYSSNQWIRVNMFKDKGTFFKLGERSFDIESDPVDKVEDSIIEFYLMQFTKAGFTCEVK